MRPAYHPNAARRFGHTLGRSVVAALLGALALAAPAAGVGEADAPPHADGLATWSATPAPDGPVAYLDAEPDPVQLEELKARVADLTLELEETTRERDRLSLLATSLEELYPRLEADRLLLTELRKPLPEERAQMEAYLERLRRLALLSDPARLGLILDRLMEVAPDYLDWREQSFGSSAEADQAYVNSGAAAFDAKLEELRDAILLSVANRLDGVLNMLDRVR